MSEEDAWRIVRADREIRFLNDKCKKIDPETVGMIAFVPEFVDAIRTYRDEFDDEAVYNVLRGRFFEMVASGTDNLTAYDLMCDISDCVTGSPLSWRKK